MGIMDQVKPGLPVGPQPNAGDAEQNAPQAPGQQPPPGPMPQSGQVSQAPQPQPAPTPQPQAPDQSQQQPQQDEFDKLMSTDEAKSPEQNPASGIVDSLRDSIKEIKANFKVGLTRNKTEELMSLENTFGQGNVRLTKDGTVQTKPDKGGWRNFDEGTLDVLQKVLTKHVSPQQLLDLVARQSGGAIQLGTQAVGGTVGALAGGAVTGSATMGAGAIGGALIGGYAGVKTGQRVLDWANDKLGQKDPDYVHENKYDSFLGALSSDAGQTITSAAGGLFQRSNLIKAADEFTAASYGVQAPEFDAIKNLPEGEMASAKASSSLQTAADTILPRTEVEGGVKQQVVSAMKAAKQKTGAAADLVTSKAQELAFKDPENPNLMKADSFLNWGREQMEKYGGRFYENGQSFLDRNKTEWAPTAPDGMEKLSNFYEHVLTKHLEGGIEPTEAREILGKIKEFGSGFGKTSVSPGSTKALFDDAWGMLHNDRNMYLSDLFKDNKSPLADSFQKSLVNYRDFKMAYDQLQKPLKTTKDIENMADILTTKGMVQQTKDLVNYQRVLSDRPEAWANLKSEMFQRVIDKSTQGGNFNAKYFNGFMSNPALEQYRGLIFDNPTHEKALQILGRQAEAYQSLANKGKDTAGMVSSMASGLTDMIGNHLPGGKAAANFIGKIFNGDKNAIEYTTEKMMENSQKIFGEKQKQAVLETINALEENRAASQMVDVPIASTGQKVKRLVPFYSPSSVGTSMRGAAGIAGQAALSPKDDSAQ